MSTYQKPTVLIEDDLAEGVYAASGAGATTGAGSNVTWAQFEEAPEHHGDVHYIRKYRLTVPNTFEGHRVRYEFQLHGPVRHAGVHHQDESTNRIAANRLTCEVPKHSAAHNNYLYVCCDTEYYPDGLAVLSGSATMMD